MERRHRIVMLLGLLTAAAPSAAAQCGSYDRTAFDNALNAARAQMALMEALTSKVDGTLPGRDDVRVLSNEDGAALDAATLAYGGQLSQAYELAFHAAQLAGQTGGQSGDTRLIVDLEVFAQRDEGRAAQLARRWDLIHADVDQGVIKGPPDAGGETHTITPLSTPLPERIPAPPPGRVACAARRLEDSLARAGRAFWDLLFPEAHAALLLGCTPPCGTGQTGPCRECVERNRLSMNEARNELDAALAAAGPCRWNRIRACAQRVWATLRYIAAVA